MKHELCRNPDELKIIIKTALSTTSTANYRELLRVVRCGVSSCVRVVRVCVRVSKLYDTSLYVGVCVHVAEPALSSLCMHGAFVHVAVPAFSSLCMHGVSVLVAEPALSSEALAVWHTKLLLKKAVRAVRHKRVLTVVGSAMTPLCTLHMCRAGQNHIHTPCMTVYAMINPPEDTMYTFMCMFLAIHTCMLMSNSPDHQAHACDHHDMIQFHV